MEPIRRDDPCDLCGNQQFEVISRRDRRGEDLTTVVCARCGLVSHLRIPTDAELKQYYATDYRSDYHGEITPSAYRVVRAWENGRRIFGQVEPYLRRGDTVFEVGAGIGCTVKQFDLAGFDAWGIEPGEGFQAFSRSQIRSKIEPGALNDLPREPICDVALLIHVIEHFSRPSLALQHIRRLLRPGGRLYVECPNVAVPHSAPKKLFHHAHIYNFTPDTLAMMAEKCGFEVVARLSGDRDPEVCILLERSDSRPSDIDLDGCRKTVAAIQRYNTCTYHLRWSYVAQRARRFAKMYSGYFTAKRHYATILEACEATEADMPNHVRLDRGTDESAGHKGPRMLEPNERRAVE